MTETERQNRRIEASLLITRINIAVGTLEARKSGLVQKHGERIKRLSRVRDKLQAVFTAPETIDGMGDVSLDPEVMALIDNPEKGL